MLGLRRLWTRRFVNMRLTSYSSILTIHRVFHFKKRFNQLWIEAAAAVCVLGGEGRGEKREKMVQEKGGMVVGWLVAGKSGGGRGDSRLEMMWGGEVWRLVREGLRPCPASWLEDAGLPSLLQRYHSSLWARRERPQSLGGSAGARCCHTHLPSTPFSRPGLCWKHEEHEVSCDEPLFFWLCFSDIPLVSTNTNPKWNKYLKNQN